VTLTMMRAVPPPTDAEKPSLAGILEGLRYALSRQELLGTYVVDMAAMFFAMPMSLFPFVATERLHAQWSLGLLYSAGYAGSLVATVTSGWVRHYHRHGRAVVYAAAVWGLAITLFGLTTNVWVALATLAAGGAADMVSGMFRSTIWNQTIPDELRGRLAGIELLSYGTGPMLGQVRASAMANVFSLRASIVSGGLLCVAATGVLAGLLPRFLGYDARTDRHAVAQRNRQAVQV
jgi:MFS family permease